MDYLTFGKALAANAVVTGAVGWLIAWAGKVWADRRLERLKTDHTAEVEDIKAQYTTQLERFRAQNAEQLERLRAELALIGKRDQAGIERHMLVFKTHFDTEYKNYLELWTACDTSYDIAAQVLELYQRSPINTQARKEGKQDAIRDYDQCREALIDGRKRRPFIQQDICDVAVKLLGDCTRLRQAYMRSYDSMYRDDSDYDFKYVVKDVKAQLDQMQDMYERLARMIADRIQRMYVLDQP